MRAQDAIRPLIPLICGVIIAGAGTRAWAQGPAVVPPGGRTRANTLTPMAVPRPHADKPVIVDVLDDHDRILWTGATRTDTIRFFTRDWADGTYTVRFRPGGEQSIRVDTEYFERVRSRCGLLLRAIEARRDEDGMPPEDLAGASNLLQRIMTIFVWMQPEQAVDGHLAFCEQRLGFRTATATARILGSGASEFTGYDEPYRPGLRERTMMFVPPHAVVDFAANAERKLTRWGYKTDDIDHVFITHEHADHFDVKALVAFAIKRGDKGLTVHSGQTVCKAIRDYLAIADFATPPQITLDELSPGDERTAGDLRVKAVAATHTAGLHPMCYIFRYHGATLYYGTDTGYPMAETLAALSQERFDVFAHELTVASGDDGVTHCDLGDCLLLIGKLRKAGAIDTWTRVVTLHQSKPQGAYLLPDYNQWERLVGYESSYDGMPLPIAYRVDEP